MSKRIAFLACPGTLPGSSNRREDAFEHDVQVEALRPALAAQGIELCETDWHEGDEAFADISLALIGTVWDYAEQKDAFLARIFQHENDHLDGVLFPDRVPPSETKSELDDQLQELETRFRRQQADGSFPDDEALVAEMQPWVERYTRA